MSGSSSTLLCRRPLRTVHASFPAYGSSLYKPALLFGPTTLMLSHHRTFYRDNGNSILPHGHPILLRL
ncbi:hypothetical protein DVP71_12275 [Yersinia enterocolitica]|nr:hypothetical protein [Yersinia enterocolitica]EKN5141067.1 hypothetical protein [Yersinia enterocolitica]TAJ03747.1 hypothetical protein EG334_14015 [Pectobacterium versatile]